MRIDLNNKWKRSNDRTDEYLLNLVWTIYFYSEDSYFILINAAYLEGCVSVLHTHGYPQHHPTNNQPTNHPAIQPASKPASHSASQPTNSIQFPNNEPKWIMNSRETICKNRCSL